MSDDNDMPLPTRLEFIEHLVITTGYASFPIFLVVSFPILNSIFAQKDMKKLDLILTK